MMILKTEERTIKDNYLLYGEQMENILDFFRENEEAFIVYVVEQRFATGRGLDYFKSFKGKPNLIDSNIKIRKASTPHYLLDLVVTFHLLAQ